MNKIYLKKKAIILTLTYFYFIEICFLEINIYNYII
jgi:hypothetical protein